MRKKTTDVRPTATLRGVELELLGDRDSVGTMGDRSSFPHISGAGLSTLRETMMTNLHTKDQAPLRGADEHEFALALIAAENRAAGRAPDDFDEDRYAAAMSRVAAGERPSPEALAASSHVTRTTGLDQRLDRALERALEELGLGEGDPVASEHHLIERQDEILAQRGFKVEPGNLESMPDEDEVLDAMREAIAEIGAPGEPRKDMRASSLPSDAAIVAAALAQGAIRPSDKPFLLALLSIDRANGLRHLADVHKFDLGTIGIGTPESIRRDPVIAEAANKFATKTAQPDDEGLLLHRDAERKLALAGKVNGAGRLEYDEAEYARALTEVQDERRRAAREAEESAAA